MGTQFLQLQPRYVLAGAIAALTMTSGVNGLAQNKPAGPAAPPPPAAESRSRRCRDSSSPRAARPC